MLYLIGSLLLALGVSVFVVSKIAEMMHAKKPAMERIFLASLVGGIAAFVTFVALIALVKNVDPMIMIISSIFAMFIISTVAFKSINMMSWSGAITTNVANIALVLSTVTAAVVLNGGSIDKVVKSVQSTFNTNTAIVESIASGNTDIGAIIEESNQTNDVESSEDVAFEDDNIEPSFKEIDLLPASTVKAIEAKKNKVYKAPKFRVISLSNARSAVGKNIRIRNTSGRSITGSLKNISANNLVIEQRINGGLATTPISIARIEKLEVFR